MTAQQPPRPDGPPARPLLVTEDPDVLEDLLRLAATAGVELEVVRDPAGARRGWGAAPLVLVGPDLVTRLGRSRLPRRAGVVVLGRDLDDASVWQRAVTVGAEHVVFLPDAEPWLVEQLAQAAEQTASQGVVVAVVGGRGGAGATTLAAALAVSAVRRGHSALLVDGDPLGGGIDLVFGGEQVRGLRWPDLSGARGRMPAAELAGALPRLQELSVLSWDRGEGTTLPAEAVAAVLSAGRRAHDLVVVDLPRTLDEAAREVLSTAVTTLLVVPAEVRASAAAARVAAAAVGLCRDLQLVVRAPGPAGLGGPQVAAALGVPLFAELRDEPGLAIALEHGRAPGGRARSPLGALCDALLAELLPVPRAA